MTAYVRDAAPQSASELTAFKLGLKPWAVFTQSLQCPRPFHISNGGLNYDATIICSLNPVSSSSGSADHRGSVCVCVCVTLARFLTLAASNCWANPITPGSKITATAFFLLFLNPREMPLTLCNPSLEIPALTVTRLDLPQSNDDWPEIQSRPWSRRGVTE